jgi:hypothetical protein
MHPATAFIDGTTLRVQHFEIPETRLTAALLVPVKQAPNEIDEQHEGTQRIYFSYKIYFN